MTFAGLPAAAAPQSGHAGGALRQGLRALRRDALIVRAVLLVTAAMLAATSLTAVAAPLVVQVLHGGAETVGGARRACRYGEHRRRRTAVRGDRPANVVVSPWLPAELRATAMSLLMGGLVATEAVGAAAA